MNTHIAVILAKQEETLGNRLSPQQYTGLNEVSLLLLDISLGYNVILTYKNQPPPEIHFSVLIGIILLCYDV